MEMLVAFQMGLFAFPVRMPPDPLIRLLFSEGISYMVDEHGSGPLLCSNDISGHDPASPGSMAACMTDRTRVVIVGPSIRFLSGISCYTIRLSDAISESADVKAVLFRHMLPKKIFPGWKRVGMPSVHCIFRA